MFDQFNLQEINQLRKMAANAAKTSEATLYNQMKMAQKELIRYFKGIYYDNLEDTNLTDTEMTNVKVEDGAMFLDKGQETFDENGAVIEATTSFQNFQVAQTGSVIAIYESINGEIHITLTQNGRITGVLPTFEGLNPHLVRAQQGYFYLVYNRLVNGFQQVFYRKVYTDVTYSEETQIDVTNAYNNEKPKAFIDLNNELYIFFETDQSGTKNIRVWKAGVLTTLTSKSTACENIQVAALNNRVIFLYEDLEQGFRQLCYRFLDDPLVEKRITNPSKNQKSAFALSGSEKVVVVSASDMNNTYFDVWKTEITSNGYTNTQITSSTADILKPRVTINLEGLETIYWIEDTKLYGRSENVSEELKTTSYYDVLATDLQELIFIDNSLRFKTYDKVERIDNVLYTYSPQTASAFYSLPITITESQAIDLYISKIGEDLDVIPYICFSASGSQFIPFDLVDTRELIENREEHYRIKNIENTTVRLKFELKTTNKYNTSTIIDYGFTYY